jgi:hypothetical protein
MLEEVSAALIINGDFNMKISSFSASAFMN